MGIGVKSLHKRQLHPLHLSVTTSQGFYLSEIVDSGVKSNSAGLIFPAEDVHEGSRTVNVCQVDKSTKVNHFLDLKLKLNLCCLNVYQMSGFQTV